MLRRLILAAVLLLPATASAATVSVQQKSSDHGFNVLTFKAAPGEENAVNLQYRKSKHLAVVTDTGAALKAGTNCTAVDAHTVSCVPFTAHYGSLESTDAALGDGDDTLTFAAHQGVLHGGNTAFVNGGPGDDLIDGRKASTESVFTGGPGSDTVKAGDFQEIDDGDGAVPATDHYSGVGTTILSYAGRTDPLTVDLASPGGAPGEDDTYKGIDKVVGGSGDDHLTTFPTRVKGSSPDDALLEGGPGDDVLIDALTTAYNRVRLEGGPGRDSFVCRAGAAELIESPEAGELLGPLCDELGDPYQYTPIYPSPFTPQSVTYRFYCPKYKKACTGTLALTDPATGASLGSTSFSTPKGVARGPATVTLTPAGQMVAAAQGPANAAVSFNGKETERWTFTLGVAGGADFDG